MLTNLEKIKEGIFPKYAFIRKIPNTDLAICITKKDDKNYNATLMDLTTDWLIILYSSIDVKTLGLKLEKLLDNKQIAYD